MGVTRIVRTHPSAAVVYLGGSWHLHLTGVVGDGFKTYFTLENDAPSSSRASRSASGLISVFHTYADESPESALIRGITVSNGPPEPLIDYLLERGSPVLKAALEMALSEKET